MKIKMIFISSLSSQFITLHYTIIKLGDMSNSEDSLTMHVWGVFELPNISEVKQIDLKCVYSTEATAIHKC